MRLQVALKVMIHDGACDMCVSGSRAEAEV